MKLKLVSWNCRSEIPGKFLNVVLEKDGEDPLDRSCVNYYGSHRVKEGKMPCINTKNEG